MKFNEEFLKRASTYANLITLIIGAAMLYIPDIIQPENQPIVMCLCSVVISACQFVKQGGLEKL